MKKLFLIILLSLFIGSLKGENKPYINPTPGEISIMAVNPFPEGIQSSRDGYEEITACGFNLLTAVGSVNYFKQQFTLIGDLNLKYIISNGDLKTPKRDLFINEFKKDKHLGGWLFVDEPAYKNLTAYKESYNALYNADPNHLIYMNLVGKVQEINTGPYKEYIDYLKYIQSMFQPPVWSFDFYPIYLKNRKITVFYESFYRDMESFLTISRLTSRPFWAFCMGMSFRIGTLEYPAANESFLRFEAFTALAYGAQGIVYWTYGQRKSNDVETYLSALVNLDGKKTPAWYAAQKVNSEIKKYNEVFYQCVVKDVRHTGSKIYKGTTKLAGSFGPFKSIKSGSAGVVVSRIENKGENYVVFVNRDVVNSQSLNLVLKNGYTVKNLTANNETIYTNQNISIKLEPGSYLILKEI